MNSVKDATTIAQHRIKNWKVIMSLPFFFFSSCGGGKQQVLPASSRHFGSPGWIRMIGFAEAKGELKEIYDKMQASAKEKPSPYDTPDGEIANIVRSHSLEPEGMRLAFGISQPIHWGDKSLPWVKREMINTVTSRANNCFY
jgi:hypothetical protein